MRIITDARRKSELWALEYIRRLALSGRMCWIDTEHDREMKCRPTACAASAVSVCHSRHLHIYLAMGLLPLAAIVLNMTLLKVVTGKLSYPDRKSVV